MRSSGAELLSVYRGHEFTAATQYVLTEGAAAIALAVVVYTLARTTYAARERRLERAVLASGLGAVLVSLVQCALGLYLAGRLIPERRAHTAITVNDVINRFDGVKMLMLAGLAIAGFSLVQRGRTGLPRWLAAVALALAATLAISSIGYLLLARRSGTGSMGFTAPLARVGLRHRVRTRPRRDMKSRYLKSRGRRCKRPRAHARRT